MIPFIAQIEYVLSLLFSGVVFCLYLPRRRYWYLFLLVVIAGMEGVWFFHRISPLATYFLMFLALFGGLMLIFEINIWQSLFLVTCTFCTQHLSYKLNLLMISLIDFNLRSSLWYYLFYLLWIFAVDLMVYFSFGRRLKRYPDIRINERLMIFVSLLVAITAIALSYFTQDVVIATNSLPLTIGTNLYAILSCLAGLVISFMNTDNRELINENKTLELLLSEDKKHYEAAKASAESVAIRYHDLKHRMQDPGVSQEEQADFKKEAELNESIYFTNSKALDVLLYEKAKTCALKNIQLTVVADGRLLAFMKSYEIYSLFGNLLDNAIESLNNEPAKENRNIKLSIVQVRNNVVVSVENYCSRELVMVNGLPQTTKGDKEAHGFGLKSCRNLAKRYDGYFKCNLDHHIFKATVLFPISADKGPSQTVQS